MMGGNVHAPVSTDVEVGAQIHMEMPFDCKVYSITDPKGRVFIAEKTSGGIVGNSIESVRADLKEAEEAGQTKADIERQLAAQKAIGQTATPLPEDEFWTYVK